MNRHPIFTIAFTILVGACTPAEPASPDAAPVEQRHGIPIGTPGQVGIDATALLALQNDAIRYHTDALLIVKDGLLVYENYFGGTERPDYAMSASKSFINLALGYLVAEGKLSLDEHAADFLPAWQTDAVKSTITIRQLANHTSGIDPDRAFDPVTGAPLALEDFLATKPMDAQPGALWIYNNDAVDALGLIAERAAGEKLEPYLDTRLFTPANATGGTWKRFADGAPMGAGELTIDPVDMLKVGMVLEHDDRGILPAGWIAASLEPNPLMPEDGLLWWNISNSESFGLPKPVVDYWATHGLSSGLVTAVQPVVGQTFASFDDVTTALRQVLTLAQQQEIDNAIRTQPHFPLWSPLTAGPSKGFYANGYLGQFLIVIPEHHMVIARMHHATAADHSATPPPSEFPELPADALALVGDSIPP